MTTIRIFLVALAVAMTPVAVHAFDPPAGPVQQLRVYRLFDATRDAFHDRFRDHARRIMARHGFDIVAMWVNWPDQAVMRRAWQAFLADDEWIRIKQESAAEHGPMVGDIEERVLRPTDYSPPLRE